MPTDAIRAYRDRTRAAQLGIAPGDYTGRLDAMRDPKYTAAMYDPAHGNALPDATKQHYAAGGTNAQLLGQRYEFLDRGGLGARGPAPTASFLPQQQTAAGFPSVQPASSGAPAAGSGGAAAMGPMGMKPGLANVQPMARPGRGLRTGFGAAGR